MADQEPREVPEVYGCSARLDFRKSCNDTGMYIGRPGMLVEPDACTNRLVDGACSAAEVGNLYLPLRHMSLRPTSQEEELTRLRGEMSTMSDFISSLSRGVACAQV